MPPNHATRRLRREAMISVEMAVIVQNSVTSAWKSVDRSSGPAANGTSPQWWAMRPASVDSQMKARAKTTPRRRRPSSGFSRPASSSSDAAAATCVASKTLSKGK